MTIQLPERRPDHELFVELAIGKTHRAEVICKLWTPVHDVVNRPVLQFISYDPAIQEFGACECDVEGTITDDDGRAEVIVRATRVFLNHFTTKLDSTKGKDVTTFFGEPDLLVIIRVERDTHDATPRVTDITFDLTDNHLLNPTKSVTHSYTGVEEVAIVTRRIFNLADTGPVTFDRQLYEMCNEKHAATTFSKLVALVKTDIAACDIDHLRSCIKPNMDTLLMMASLASRQATVNTGWSAADSWNRTMVYEKCFSLPDESKTISHAEVLIDSVDFDEFINTAISAYEQFDKEEKMSWQRAVHKVIPRPQETCETRILSLFSALESFVLMYRHRHDLGFVVQRESEWKTLEKDLTKAIKQNPVTNRNTRLQKMLIEQLPSLQRVPLREGFGRLCRHYRLKLDDLWPVFHAEDGATLHDIRNRLMHGDYFSWRQYHALVNAVLHLECTVERILISIIGWPLKRSNVSRSALASWDWTNRSQLTEDMASLNTEVRGTARRKDKTRVIRTTDRHRIDVKEKEKEKK